MHRSIPALALASLLLAGAEAEAKYLPIPLHDMLGSSDLIVEGRIDQVGEETFRLQIEQVVAGDHDAPTIEVRKFRNWPCAARWAPYEAGQRVLLCLFEMPGADGTPTWRIRSAGGEGEMPIVGDHVHYRRGNLPVEGEGRFQIHGQDVFATRLLLDDFVETIRAYRGLYRWSVERSTGVPRVTGVEAAAGAEEIEAFRATSGLAAWLVDQTTGYKPFG